MNEKEMKRKETFKGQVRQVAHSKKGVKLSLQGKNKCAWVHNESKKSSPLQAVETKLQIVVKI